MKRQCSIRIAMCRSAVTAALVACALGTSNAMASSITSVCGGVTTLFLNDLPSVGDCVGYQHQDAISNSETSSRSGVKAQPAIRVYAADSFDTLARSIPSVAPRVLSLDKRVVGVDYEFLMDEVWALPAQTSLLPEGASGRTKRAPGSMFSLPSAPWSYPGNFLSARPKRSTTSSPSTVDDAAPVELDRSEGKRSIDSRVTTKNTTTLAGSGSGVGGYATSGTERTTFATPPVPTNPVATDPSATITAAPSPSASSGGNSSNRDVVPPAAAAATPGVEVSDGAAVKEPMRPLASAPDGGPILPFDYALVTEPVLESSGAAAAPQSESVALAVAITPADAVDVSILTATPPDVQDEALIAAEVPEPSSFLLVGVGVLGVCVRGRRRQGRRVYL